MPLSYLKRILTAKVYDVADESPLEPAAQLSVRLANRLLLLRLIASHLRLRGPIASHLLRLLRLLLRCPVPAHRLPKSPCRLRAGRELP